MNRLLILLLILFSCRAMTGENLLKNGSFEDWAASDTLPTYWTTHEQDKPSWRSKVSPATVGAKDGKTAVSFADRTPMGYALNQSVPVQAGSFYDISLWTKTDIKYYEVRLMYHWSDATGKRIPNVNENPNPISASGVNDWLKLEHKNMQAPQGAVTLTVSVVPNDAWSKTGVPGTFLVDDVRVEKSAAKDAAEPYKPLAEVYLADRLNITLDGEAAEPEWQATGVIGNLMTPAMHSPEVAQTQVRFLADGEYLYFHGKMHRNAGSATLPAKQSERDHGNMSDLLELFFKPSAQKPDQYHLMFDAAASIWDMFQIYRDPIPHGESLNLKTDLTWTAPSLEIKTRIVSNDLWEIEGRIAFKDMNVTAPEEGTRWTANLCRGDYGSGISHNQLSSWGLLPIPDFGNDRYWGTIVFRQKPLALQAVTIQPQSSQVAFSVVAGESCKADFVAEQLNGASVMELGRKSLPLESGKNEFVQLALNSLANLYWLSIYDNGELVYRSGGRAPGTIIELTAEDLLNVRQNKLYIANDRPFYNHFAFQHTLPGKKGNKSIGNPDWLQLTLVAEVPEGVEIPYLAYSNWGGSDNPPLKPVSITPFQRNGKAYRRYILPAYLWENQKPLIFFQSSLPAGTIDKLYLYAAWKDGAQIPVEYPFEVVTLGRHKPFERMQLRLDDLTLRTAEMITPDPAKNLPSMGVNVFAITLEPDKKKLDYPETKQKFSERLEEFVKATKASGNRWYLCLQNDLNSALYHWTNVVNWDKRFAMTPDNNAIFYDVGGRPAKVFGMIAACPTYRGPNYRNLVNTVINSGALQKYGVSWLVLDWEIFPENGCFCDRCYKELWPKWVQEHNLNVGDPKEFMKTPEKFPESAAAWKEFSFANRCQLYVDFKNDIAKAFPGKTTWTGMKPGFIVSDWIAPKKHLLRGVDFFDWPFGYRDPATQYKNVKEQYDGCLNKSFKNVVASCNSMQGCELNRQYEPVSLYYTILESASYGVQGFEWWYLPVFETMSYKFMMDGLRAIRPFEDIILDGAAPEFNLENPDALVRRIVSGNEALYYVRNYVLKEPRTVTLEIEVAEPSELFEATSQKCLAQLQGGKNRLAIPLSPALQKKGSLLYLGPKGKGAVRFANAQRIFPQP